MTNRVPAVDGDEGQRENRYENGDSLKIEAHQKTEWSSN